MERHERLRVRNKKVNELFVQLCRKYPKWRTGEIVKEVARQMFLSHRTVDAILKGEGTYAD